MPTISIAKVQVDRDTFIYTHGLSYCWYEDVKTLCTTVTVNIWGYMVLSLASLYGLEIVPGKPCGGDSKEHSRVNHHHYVHLLR